MPSPAPFPNPQNPPPYPALYLYPLNDTFIPKHISLFPSGHSVKIGRQTNAKTNPGERNGYFDSKVLSRQHAEVWEENGKIFIRDVKSSNGTFINGERLSAEGVESEPFELNSDDIVEFGIDIVGEDNKTIIHHKVAARVSCVLTEQQASIAARSEQQQQQSQGQYPTSMMPQSGSGSAGPFNFGPGGPQGQRRAQIPHPGLNGIGGMGGSVRPPGKSGLTFDHILTRLQGELAKSRETGHDLQTLSGAMNEIQDTLGGSMPSNLPVYPHALPSVRPPQSEPPPAVVAAPVAAGPSAESLADLRAQLDTTQSSLTTHVEKIRALEGVFSEQEALKEEVRTLRDLVGVLQQGSRSVGESGDHFDDMEEEVDLDDDSDARSIATVIPHSLEPVDEEDEEDRDEMSHEETLSESSHDIDMEAVDDREHARPRTPEPGTLGMGRGARSSTLRSPIQPSSSLTPSSPTASSSNHHVIHELTTRLGQISSQLESALSISSTLQAQHAAAQETIIALEEKVKRLEGLVSAVTSEKTPPDVPETVTSALNSLKSSLQGQWSSEWAQERERLKRSRDEWETQMLGLVDERIKVKLANHTLFGPPAKSVFYPHGNGGLVTPPSPRSLSADSSPGRRRRRRSSSRGRSSSPKGSGNSDGSSADSIGSEDAITELAKNARVVLATPAPSISSSDGRSLNFAETPSAEKTPAAAGQTMGSSDRNIQIQTALGVLVLSMAAAAVIWRVKPE